MRSLHIIPAVFFFIQWLSVLFASGQPGFPEEITAKFLRYCSENPWEEVYLHTDRNEYIAGEEIWFCAYLINRQSMTPSAGSKILYVEILNRVNMPVAQKKIMLNGGFGPGEIIIPDTLSTGIYCLRAYTNRMKNFMSSNCFMKEINIYNAIKPAGIIADKTETGAYSTGSVLSAGSSLSAATGFNAVISNSDPDCLIFNILAEEDYRQKNNNLCYLFIHTHGIINFTGAVNLTERVTKFTVRKNLLLPGINHITFFSSAGEPLLEKYIFTPGFRSRSMSVNSPDSCGRREKIRIEINLIGMKGSADTSLNISMAVRPVTGSEDKTDLADYLIFGSEFGIIPDEIRNTPPEELPVGVLESFLQGIKSSWVDWEAILSGNYPVIKYPVEKEYHYLSGRLINRATMTPVTGEYVFLSVPGRYAKFQYSVTGNDGKFVFCLPVDDVMRDLIIQPENPVRNIALEIFSPFSDLFPQSRQRQVNPAGKTPSHIMKWSTNYQVNRIYAITHSELPLKRNAEEKEQWRFYGRPDIEIKMDEYIKLPVMEEVFFELLPGVILKKRGESQYDISFIDPPEFRTFGKPPLLMVDGVIIHDASVIGNMNPENVERIDVVKDRYLAGDCLFYGIVNVVTKAGNFSGISLPDYALRLKYRAVDPVSLFISPDHSENGKSQDKYPDFRNTLYWNGSLKPGTDGKITVDIWASDYPAVYEINVQGMDSGGEIISVKKSVKIR